MLKDRVMQIIDYVKRKDMVFLTALFLIGGALLIPYGAHMDQDLEQRILCYNYISYCERLGIKGNYYQEMMAEGFENIRDSIEQDHGMAVFYPMIWIWKFKQQSSYLANILWHSYNYLICFLGVLSLYFLVKRMFGKNTAIMTTALYFFTPRMFAEFHYNNIDMILLSLLLIVFYQGWRLYEDTSYKRVICFAAAGAFLANIRIIGLFLWGLIGVTVALAKLVKKEFNLKLVRKIVICIVLFGMVFYLITPACQGNLIPYFDYVLNGARKYVMWDGQVFFQGRLYSPTKEPLPWNYLPMMIAISTPVGILCLTAAGFVFLLFSLFFIGKKEPDERGKIIVASGMILCGVIPLLYAVFTHPTLYNGWRHFYFVYASMLVLCAVCIERIFAGVRSDRKKKVRQIINILAGAYVVVLIAGILANHPFEYAYYNVFAGKNAEERFELDYWNLSYKQTFDYLASKVEGDITYSTFYDIPSRWGIQIQMPSIRGRDRMRFDITEKWNDAEFVVANLTYAQMYSKEEYQKLQQEYRLYKAFDSYGNRVCEIYQRK